MGIAGTSLAKNGRIYYLRK